MRAAPACECWARRGRGVARGVPTTAPQTGQPRPPRPWASGMRAAARRLGPSLGARGATATPGAARARRRSSRPRPISPPTHPASHSPAASSSPAASAGVSYTKAGGDAGALPGDAPHWLAELGGRPPSAFELRRKLEAGETLAEDEARVCWAAWPAGVAGGVPVHTPFPAPPSASLPTLSPPSGGPPVQAGGPLSHPGAQ